MPIEDEFSFKWLELVGKRALEGLANRKDLDEDTLNTGNQAQKHRSLLALFERGETAIAEIKLRVTEALRFEGRTKASRSPAKSLEDYADMFRAIGLPPIAKNFRDDSVFSSMRVAGPNPVMLQRLKAIDERLPITNALFQVAAPHDSLDAAIAEGRLYLADYAVLDGAELGTLPNGQKYLYAPLALFVITGPRKELLPVAIQCQQKPAADNPIFTPKDGFNWLIAKTIVETADGNINEGSTHLARTHLIMEAFVMTNHFHLLLWPHEDGDLSRWRQWLMTSHVRRYHRHYNGSGHVWQGRFKAFPVQSDEHYLTVLRYVERNPLRVDMVERSQDWEWSGLKPTVRSGLDGLLCDGPILKPAQWTRHVNGVETVAELKALRNSLARGTPFGDTQWQAKTAAKLGLESSLRSRGRPTRTNK